MKRRLLHSDDQQLSAIPGSDVIYINPQPRKVARVFDLGFSARDTHFLMQDSELPLPNNQTPIQPKVEDDKEAQRILDECAQDLDALYHEIEKLEENLMDYSN